MLISSRDELKSYAVDGRLKEPVWIKPGSSLMRVDFLTSLDNIHCEGKFAMGGLANIKKLNGIRIGEKWVLSGLSSVRELDGFMLGKNAHLKGLACVDYIGSSFIPMAGGILSGLKSLSYIEPAVMWPKGFSLKDVSPAFADSLPDMIKARLNIY